MAKEKKAKTPRKPKQKNQETILAPKLLDVPGDVVAVQEKVTLPTERKKIVAHTLLPLVESLLIRVENLEKKLKALEK